MSLTGQDKYRKGFEPLLEDVTFVAQNDVEALHAAVNANTCAIVLEPIFGEGGILECSEDFLRACRTLADQHQAALIFDEIQCGLGRTGKIFAFQSFGVSARHCHHRQADCCRSAARRVPVERTFRLRDFARTARHDLWRRAAGLPRRRSNTWRSSKKNTCSKTSRRLAAICISNFRNWPRSTPLPAKRAAADSFRASCSTFPRARWSSRPGRGRALQRHPGHGPALPAAVPAGRKARG